MFFISKPQYRSMLCSIQSMHFSFQLKLCICNIEYHIWRKPSVSLWFLVPGLSVLLDLQWSHLDNLDQQPLWTKLLLLNVMLCYVMLSITDILWASGRGQSGGGGAAQRYWSLERWLCWVAVDQYSEVISVKCTLDSSSCNMYTRLLL